MHLDVSQEAFYAEFYGKNARAQKEEPHFVRACAVEMQSDVSQKPLFTEIYR